jgi:hypothetical protein
MTIKNRNFRTVLTALAVTTALPTMAGAQEADPSMTTAAPVETPTPVTTAAPMAAEPAATVTSDPFAPADIVDSAPAAEATTDAAPVAPATTTRRAPSPATTARAAAAPAVTEPAVADPGPAASEAAVADPFASAPVVEPVPVVPSVDPVNADASVYADLLPLAGVAGLGLIALAAIGMILRRRKRVEPIAIDNHEPSFATTSAPAAVEEKRDHPMWTTARPVAAPAFGFGATTPATAPGGNRIEQALRGPTPDNPFLSLKKRLKRAAFFDQRERQVRAGVAERVSPMAGLPRRMVEMLQGGVARPRYQMA